MKLQRASLSTETNTCMQLYYNKECNLSNIVRYTYRLIQRENMKEKMYFTILLCYKEAMQTFTLALIKKSL